jgi:hypothetical protein
MSLTQFLVLAVVAALVTVPAVLLIPRARTSTAFDRLLWAATVVVGFLVAWVAVAMAKDANNVGPFAVGDTPILPAFIGALAGALALNLPLWLADRFGGSSGEESETPTNPDTPIAAGEENPRDRD